MTKEEIVIGLMLLRDRPNYSYIMVVKEENNINYTVIEPHREVE